jgi:hypothetical protein
MIDTLRPLLDCTEEPSEKSLVYQQILFAYSLNSRSLNAEQAALLLKAQAHINAFPILEERRDPFVEHEISSNFMRFAFDIQAALQSDETFSLLNEIADSVTQRGQHSLEWDLSAYPLCRAEEGGYSFDVRDACFYQSGQAFSILPDSVTTHADYRMVFGSDNFMAQLAGSDSFEFKDKKGVNCRVLREGGFHIQKELALD